MNLLHRKLRPGQGEVVLEAAAPSHQPPIDGSVAATGKAMFADLAFQYPLKLMSPKVAPCEATLGAGVVALYMLSYGGGLVFGDDIRLKIHLKPHAHLVLLTQGNTKVFRERPGRPPSSRLPPASGSTPRRGSSPPPHHGTRQRMKVTIEPNASLFLLPAPVTCFEGASYSQRQDFHLVSSSDSSLLLLDWFTSGRLSRGENWAFERYRSTNRIYVDGKRLVNDVLLLEGPEMAKKMAGYPCYCTLFIYGRPMARLLEHFVRITRDHTQYKQRTPDEVLWSFSELEEGTSGVVRCAGIETEAVKFWLERQLVGLKALIGRDLWKAAWV